MKKEKIGFIGLGTMGFAMCYGLYKSGYSMVLPTYRREIDQSCSFIPLAPDEKAKTALYDEMLGNGCESAKDAAELFAKSDFIMISMPTSKQVEMNMYGEEGILENARPGTIVIDLTSADATSTQKLARECEGKGIELLDCPISGGQEGATNQTLTVMCGGKREAFEKALPILNTIGNPEKVNYVGPSGAGDALKCANNFLSCACMMATAEALTVAAKAGIDPRVAAKVIGASGGSSNASTYKFPHLIFPGRGMNMAVDLMKKDIGLFNALAKENKVPNFYGALSYQLFDIRSASGDGMTDFSSVPRLFEDWTGEKLYGIEEPSEEN
ncbi:MAG: NAD(P)-dependent oxidoreductase [Lachnospiraceae bacterium]|jgi:3-hydroxyisobutyrate dehydrogenase-like beta-hydroxyacid dehydrogenase|nr:NAD(P)-dependent oxidoreductase [Lachnospiraceae bacterium]